ncbi:MAG: hypothetical protein GF393_06895, partial [Armatimonadia bacterium]|nr:hypothetical protein [Armatimonadia bacterium]
MSATRFALLACALAIITGFAASAAQAATIPPVVRGEKVYTLLPEAGPLQITISKRDMNIYEDADRLVADLYGPRREHLGHAEIPDDGETGKAGHSPNLQTATMQVDVEAPGTYRLVIMCPARGDFVHGIETSSGGAMVEGLILLNDGNESGRVYFAAPDGAV